MDENATVTETDRYQQRARLDLDQQDALNKAAKHATVTATEIFVMAATLIVAEIFRRMHLLDLRGRRRTFHRGDILIGSSPNGKSCAAILTLGPPLILRGRCDPR